MEADWDLHAVVRGCNSSVNTAVATSTATTMATTTTTSTSTTISFKDDAQIQSWFSVSPFRSEQSSSGHLFTLTDPLFEARNAAIEELHELYKPFFPKSPQPPISPNRSSIITTRSQPMSSSISSITTTSSSRDRTQTQLTPQRPHKQSNACSVTSSTAPRKRRKNQLKRVCHVPAEALSSDIWAWRKYGQKPIKGSPYPRGYYRCSSSKGCLARKQVERNRSDPGMFIVTYTAEHNHPAPTHRNSLAGSTRQKPCTPQTAATTTTTTGGESNKPCSPTPSTKPALSSSSPATSMEEEAVVVPPSTNTGSIELDMVVDEEEEEDDDDELGVSDFGIGDDFFVGLEGLGSEEDGLPDHFPASFGLPWAANNAATAAGGI